MKPSRESILSLLAHVIVVVTVFSVTASHGIPAEVAGLKEIWRELAASPASPIGHTPDGLQRLATAIVLENVPATYEDDRKWGNTRRRIDGWHVRMDGLKLRTKRKWKEVNHGTWKRYEIRQLNPRKNLHVRIRDIKTLPDGRSAFRVELDSKINGVARLAEWNRGVRLMSVTVDVTMNVKIVIDCRLRVELNPVKLPPDIRLHPEVTDARLQLSDFRVNRISHFDGPIVRELGSTMRRLIEKKVDEKRPQLVAKINRQIARHDEDLRISLHDALKEKWQSLTTKTSTTNALGDASLAPSQPSQVD